MFIGRNGVGKSSLGLVLSLLRDFALERNLANYFSSENLSLFAPNAPIEIETDVEIGGTVHKVRLIVEPKSNANSGYRIIESVLDEEARDALKRVVVVKPQPGMISSRVRPEAEPLDVSCSNIVTWFAAQEAHNVTLRKAFTERFSLVFDDFVGYSYKSMADGEHLQCQFEKNGDGFTTIDLSMLSDGEKCQFVSTAISVVNENTYPMVCFWDEPDNYITTSEEAALFYALARSFQKRGQFIATSHSELGILTFNDCETYVLDRRGHSSPILPPMNLSEMRDKGLLTGSLRSALLSGEVAL